MNCEEITQECLTGGVLLEVLAERKRQDEKWGQQNHPWIQDEGPDEWAPDWAFVYTEAEAKNLVDLRDKAGRLDYAGILTEEYHEALAADDIAKVREELVQVAAVAVAAIESIDRNGR